MSKGVNRAMIACAVLAAGATLSRADDRKFTYVDETRVAALHSFEFEQWFTWKHRSESGDSIDNFEFREELEYGLTEKIQLGAELPAWHFTSAPEPDRDGPRFDHLAFDIKYIFLDAATEPLGLAAKAELEVGEEEIALEGRLILQKNWEKWEFAYNFLVEAVWENDEDGKRYREESGELNNRLAADYEIAPQFFVGAELLHEIPLPEWHTGRADQVLWIGPNASYHSTNWAITATFLPRVSDSEGEPHYQLRMIFEIDF